MTARPGGGGNPPDARRVAQSMTTPEQAARLTAMAAEIRASLTATGVLAPVDPALAALMTRTTERPDLPPDPTTEEHPMPDLSEAAIDLLFDADNYSIDGLGITSANEQAAQELLDEGFAEKSTELCGDPCRCEVDVIRLTSAGVAELRAEADGPVSTPAYIAAEHRAQIRLANAGRGLTRMMRLVERGTMPQASLDASRDEYEAAQRALGAVHSTPIGSDPLPGGLHWDALDVVARRMRAFTAHWKGLTGLCSWDAASDVARDYWRGEALWLLAEAVKAGEA